MIPSSHQLTLKLLQKCPACQARIPTSGVHILEETENNIIAHLSCGSCRVNYLTYVMNHPQGLVGNAIMTDLNYEEALQFLDTTALTANSFLELYTLIHSPDFIANLQISSTNNYRKDTYV